MVILLTLLCLQVAVLSFSVAVVVAQSSTAQVQGGQVLPSSGDALDYTSYLEHHRKPVLHFLVLTWVELFNLDIWTLFFKGVPVDRYRVWVHPKDRHAFAEALPTTFNVTVVDEYYTDYCDNAKVMNHLLESALKGSQSSNDMFLFVSEDALPVKPFSAMYHRLAVRHVMSLFCIAPSAQWYDLGHSTFLVKAHQWMVLTKMDAIRTVKQWQRYASVSTLVKSIDDRLTFTPQYQEQNRSRLKGETCMEEWWFTPAIFGVHNASAAGLNPFNYPSDVEQGVCPMYVWWPDYDKNSQFKRGVPELTEEHTKGNQRLWSVPLDFIKGLRQSSFLFARKWSDRKGYNKISDSELTLTQAFSAFVF